MQGYLTRLFVNELEEAQVLNRTKKTAIFIFLNKTFKKNTFVYSTSIKRKLRMFHLQNIKDESTAVT